MAWMPSPEVVLLESCLGRNTVAKKPDFASGCVRGDIDASSDQFPNKFPNTFSNKFSHKFPNISAAAANCV